MRLKVLGLIPCSPFSRSNATVAIKSRTKEGVDRSAPSFARPMGDVAVDEGQKLRITTPVKGNPIPGFSWTKDGAPLEGDRVHFFSDGELVSLHHRDLRIKRDHAPASQV